VDGDDIWFVHGKLNVLMRYDMRENYTYVVGIVPGEKMFREMLYSAVCKWNDKVYLIPCFAKKLTVYSIKENRFTEIPICNSEEYGERGLFERAYVEGKYLYCIPFLYEAFLKINMESEEVEYTGIGKKEDIYIIDVTKLGNEIAAINAHSNQLLFYNMDTSVLRTKSLENGGKKVVAIASIGNSLYLFDKSSQSLIKLDIRSMRETRLDEIPYEAIKMTTISSEFIMIDSTYDHEMKLINDKGKTILERSEMIENKKGNLYAVYCSGIDGLNSADEKVSFYFSRDKYAVQKFNEGKLEHEFCMVLSADELKKLENMVSKKIQLKTDENSLLKLRDWIGELREKGNSNLDKSDDCGKQILLEVKKAEA